MEPTTPQSSSPIQPSIPSTHSHFPTVGSLFKDTWSMFKGSLLNLVLINIIFIVLAILILISAAALLLPFGALSVIQAVQANTFQPDMLFPLLTGGAVILIIVVIIFAVLSLVITVAQVFIAANYKEKYSLGHSIKNSLPKVLPFFVVGIIVGFIELGGYLLFIIPGFIFSIFLMFAAYEVILNNQGIISSIKRSIKIVHHNFWEVFVRILLIIAIYLGYMFISFMIEIPIQILVSTYKQFIFISIFWTICSYLIDFFLGFYILCYSVALYKQTAEGLKSEKGNGKGLFWMFISSILGWIVGILLIVTIGAFAWSMINSQRTKTEDTTNKYVKQIETQKNEAELLSPESKKLFDTINADLSTAVLITNKPSLTETEKTQVQQLLVKSVDNAKQLTTDNPTNSLTWNMLGNVYDLLNFVENSDRFAEDSYKKAINLQPNYYQYHEKLGGVYMRTERYSDAINEFRKVVELNPEYANGYFNLGVAYKEYGAMPSANEAFEKTLELLPSNSPDKYMIEAQMSTSPSTL